MRTFYRAWKCLSRKNKNRNGAIVLTGSFAVLNLLSKPSYDQLVINVMKGWSGYFSIRRKTKKSNLFQVPTQMAQKDRILCNWWRDNTSFKFVLNLCIARTMKMIFFSVYINIHVYFQITDQEKRDFVTPQSNLFSILPILAKL